LELTMADEEIFETAKSAVVKVGAGRGFIVSAGDDRHVITAAHCLPHYPEPHLANGAAELTYVNILGRLEDSEQTVWAELVEFNAASDFALLGEPDGQVLWDECGHYQAFTELAMMIGQSPPAHRPHEWIVENETPAWVLSLDGQWCRCTVQNGGRFLVAIQGKELIKPGMSGSPILNEKGAAIGVVSTGGDGDFNMNPSLTDCLPPWLLRKLDPFAIGEDQ
jgi:S1-C subfamily serine protease